MSSRLRGTLGLFGLLLLMGLGAWVWVTQAAGPAKKLTINVRRKAGTLLIAGGGRLPASIRLRFVELAGGPTARIVVIPAYELDVEAMSRLHEFWKDYSLVSLSVLSAKSRREAEQPEFVDVLKSATGVWLSGGTQAFLAERYVDTPVEQELLRLVDRGGIVGGTSAGASIMTQTLIVEGREEAMLGRGMDLMPDAVIDQHFLRRNRLTRLMGVLHKHPELIGFGIDERTALLVQPRSGSLTVIGDSYVMAVVPMPDRPDPRLEILKAGDETSLEGLRNPAQPVAQAYEFDEAVSDPE